MAARAWRKEPRGSSWRLVAGRGGDRVRVNLGAVTEPEAEQCRIALEGAEADGTVAQVLALYGTNPAAVVQLLLGDADVAALLPEPAVDYGAMTVAEYFDGWRWADPDRPPGVYWPVRSDPNSEIGVSKHTADNEALLWRHRGRTQTGEIKERRGILDGPIGSTRLRDLDDVLWHRWMTAQTHLSPRSQALLRNAYRCLLAYARSQGHTKFKPEFFRLKGASGGKTATKVDPLDADEVGRLLAAADPMRRAMWAVGAGQGLRPSELVRMDWADIDWAAGMMRVRGTKTDASAATIPMTPFALRELRAYWAQLGEPRSGLCWTYGGRGLEREPSAARPFTSYKRALASDARAAGITRRVTPYLLRHSFATIAWSLDVPQDVARRIMRHTSARMLDEVYTRPRPAQLAARVAAFDIRPAEAA